MQIQLLEQLSVTSADVGHTLLTQYANMDKVQQCNIQAPSPVFKKYVVGAD